MSDLRSENLDLPAVTVVKTTPPVSKEHLGSQRKCYMGISLGNPVFQGKCLRALVLWATENFDETLVVVGDYLRRHNERILNGLDDDRAGRAAVKAGDAFLEQAGGLFDELANERLVLTRWQEHLGSDEYEKARASLDGLFESDANFRACVEKDAAAFVERLDGRGRPLAVTTQQAIEGSCQYLLEEIAVFSALAEQGWTVELYPGPELEVLVEIAKGTFRDIPRGLKDRINVELRTD